MIKFSFDSLVLKNSVFKQLIGFTDGISSLADTGCSLNIVFLKNIPDSVSACVHWTSRLDRQMVGPTPALQQNWQSLEKSQLFKEKTQYLLNTMKKVSSKFFTGPEKIVKREALQTSFQQPHISICM